MIMKMEAKQHVSALLSLTFPNTDMMLSGVTWGDIDDTFKQLG